jgi:hypothetical protein
MRAFYARPRREFTAVARNSALTSCRAARIEGRARRDRCYRSRMANRCCAWLLFLCAKGCAAPAGVAVEPAPTTTVAVPRDASAATATASSAETPPPKPAAARTCLMWRVCGCNHGCSGVGVAREALHEGMKVTIASGLERGREAYVASAPSADGNDTLVLTRDDPAAPGACSLAQRSPLIGYGCLASQSGPVPKNACATGCDD